MRGSAEFFSADYEEARRKFLQAAHAAGLQSRSHVHPREGLHGEELAVDVVRDGPADAHAILVLSSGCHGVEGFCGSGVQVAALQDEAWRETVRKAGVAVLYVHALNPFGFSWLARATHENIDLNRNFHDFSQPLPHNAGYAALHPLLVPGQWPPGEDNQRAVAQVIAARGMPALQSEISRGQHEFPDGLFFGGTGPAWSNTTLRSILREHGSSAARLGWIDIHTGLGPSGAGERIFAGPPTDDTTLARARSWWEGGGATPITSIHDGTSSSAVLTGMMWTSAYEECPQAQITGMALEYGTQPLLATLQALRAEQWLKRNPEAPELLATAIRDQVKSAFYSDTTEWKRQVIDQAMDALHQAAKGLAG